MSVDVDLFKAGMRHLAGHVCLITTSGADGQRSGLTATAVCSVSASPPTLLCCVNRQSASHSAIVEAGFFAVNVLTLEDQHLANRFAGAVAGEERFAVGDWLAHETGAPILQTAAASFVCRLSEKVDVATHGILFGEILGLQVRQDELKPLLYAQGNYGSFVSLENIS